MSVWCLQKKNISLYLLFQHLTQTQTLVFMTEFDTYRQAVRALSLIFNYNLFLS